MEISSTFTCSPSAHRFAEFEGRSIAHRCATRRYRPQVDTVDVDQVSMWRSRVLSVLFAIAIAGCGSAAEVTTDATSPRDQQAAVTSLPMADPDPTTTSQTQVDSQAGETEAPLDLDESVQLLRDNLRWNRLLSDLDHKQPDLWPVCPVVTSAGDQLVAEAFGSFDVECVPLAWVEGEAIFEDHQPELAVSTYSAEYHDIGEAPWLWIDNPLINQEAIQAANFWIAEDLDVSEYRIAEFGELSFYCLDDPSRSCVAAWHPPTFRGGDDISVNAVGTDETGVTQLAALDRHLVDLIHFFNGLAD